MKQKSGLNNQSLSSVLNNLSIIEECSNVDSSQKELSIETNTENLWKKYNEKYVEDLKKLSKY